MSRKKKQWEPETTRKIMYQMLSSRRFVDRLRSDGEYWIGAVRIIREKDYQRLLKLSKAQKRTP